jgi:hypothetical protein
MFKNAFLNNNSIPNVVIYDDTASSIQRKNESGFDKKFTGSSISDILSKFRALNERRVQQGLSLLILALPLSACGGGSSSSAPAVSGRAIDGYLAGSKVFLDSNPDVFVLTSDEAGSQGTFSGLFGTGSIVVQGGTDVSTGKSFTGELRAPEGATVVSPLTTIVEAVVAKAAESGGAPVSVAEAQAQVAKGLGLSADADLIATDFVATGSAGMSKAAAQVASVISMVSAAGGTDASAAVMAEVATKISAAGAAGGKSEVLTKATEMKAILETVSATTDVFVDAPGAADLASVIDNIATVAETVNAKIAVAESIKDIAATQQAVQEDFVESIASGVVVDVAQIDTLIEEATAELDAYIETLGDDAGFDFETVLDASDVDTDIQVVVISDDGTITVPETPVTPEVPTTPETPVIPTTPVVGGGGGGGGGGAAGSNIVKGVSAGGSISDALAAAALEVTSSDDTITIYLGSGRFSENVTLDADALGVSSVTIAGANFGTSLKADVSGDISTNLSTVVSGLAFDTADGSRASNETWIDGRITVASDNVTLDGLRLHSYNGALKFDGTDIDSFTLKNSYVTGFNGADSLSYTGDGTNEGWTITGNMIGGVAGGVGGSLNLTNIDAAQVSENVFFRPGAAHMYLTDASNVTVSNNFFYHGLHADGANFDNKLTAFQAAADAGYGYVGFNGGAGYGYGGYGFGYGYGSSNSDSFTNMGSYGGYGGYGPSGYIPTGYGLDAYGGGGDSQSDYVYYGRNYIAEVKGDSDTIAFTGNWGAYNSGGIQFWDEGDADHSFNTITISQNQMSNFINADQDGLLETLSSRHKSGLVGGVVFQVKDGSTSDNLTISGNKIYGSIDQILNDNDLDALIEVDGEVNNVVISENTLEWAGSVASSTQINGNSGAVVTQGILLAGDVNGGATTGQYIILQDNTFETAAIGKTTYVSDAILLSDTDYSSLGIGRLSSDVIIIDGSSETYADWLNSDDVGNYDEGHSSDGSADTATYNLNTLDTSIGSYSAVTELTDGQDILFLQTNTIA